MKKLIILSMVLIIGFLFPSANDGRTLTDYNQLATPLSAQRPPEDLYGNGITRPMCSIFASYELTNDDHSTNNASYFAIPQAMHNLANEYLWNTAGRGEGLLLSSTGVHYTYVAPYKYREFAFPYQVGNADCVPQYKYGKILFDSDSEIIFDDYTSVEFEHYNAEKDYVKTVYSLNCKYIPIGIYDATQNFGPIPSSYGKEGFTWEHGSAKGEILRCSIAYGVDIADKDITVPKSGYVYRDVVLNGVTMTLRVSSKTISVKATKPSDPTSFKFAFGTQLAEQNLDKI